MGGIRLRPHHLLCIQGFRGQGYSPGFVANMARIIDRLESDPAQKIRVVFGADDVCAACPHLEAGKCVRPEQQVEVIDGRISEELQLSDGSKKTWRNLLALISEKIEASQLGNLCSGCRWVDLNYCTKGLDKLAQRQLSQPDD